MTIRSIILPAILLLAAWTSTASAGDDFFLVTEQAGVVPNDGLDDAPGIQTAINNHRHIHFPPGTYNLGSTLVIPSNTMVTGSGATSIIRHYINPPSTPAADQVDHDLMDIYTYGTTTANVSVSGLMFVGNDQAAEDAVGIWVKDADHIVIRDCHFRSFGNVDAYGKGQTPISCWNTTKTLIDGNDVREGFSNETSNSGADISYYTGNKDAIVTNNHVQSTSKIGIDFEAFSNYETQRVIVANNVSIDHSAHNYMGSYGGRTRTMMFNNNVAGNAQCLGIYIPMSADNGAGPEINPNSGEVMINNNVVSHCGGLLYTGSFSAGITIGGNGLPAIIKGNVISNTGYGLDGNPRYPDNLPSGIFLSDNRNTIVADNIISHTYGGGLFAYRMRSGILRNNQIIDLIGQGIDLENNNFMFDYIDIANNRIDVSDAEQIGINLWGLEANNFSENPQSCVRVHDNHIRGYSMTAIGAYPHMSNVGLKINSQNTVDGQTQYYPMPVEVFGNTIETFCYGVLFTNGPDMDMTEDARRAVLRNNFLKDITIGFFACVPYTSTCYVTGPMNNVNVTTPLYLFGGPDPDSCILSSTIALYPRAVLLHSAVPTIGNWTAGDRVIFHTPVTSGGTKYLGAVYNGSSWTCYGATQ
ncbi:MAG: hypothetical protein IT440_02490 [Phycisphaeraceae bacterium]|nr:hypothetical protein [Phycisphaeraceae bacterium]